MAHRDVLVYVIRLVSKATKKKVKCKCECRVEWSGRRGVVTREAWQLFYVSEWTEHMTDMGEHSATFTFTFSHANQLYSVWLTTSTRTASRQRFHPAVRWGRSPRPIGHHVLCHCMPFVGWFSETGQGRAIAARPVNHSPFLQIWRVPWRVPWRFAYPRQSARQCWPNMFGQWHIDHHHFWRLRSMGHHEHFSIFYMYGVQRISKVYQIADYQ